MSRANPILGIDVHPTYQAGIDFARARRNAEFCVIKATQGDSYVAGGLSGFKGFVEKAKAQRFTALGFYHFLDASASGTAQARHFLRTVGDVSNRLVAVDFEGYADLSPTNGILFGFIAELRRHIGDHPIIVYSSESFWNSGHPSGAFGHFGADVAWDARYPDMFKHRFPKVYYQAVRRWYGWGEKFGGVEPLFWQFTSAGLCGGLYVDMDAFRGTKEELVALTKGPKGTPPPEEGTLPNYVSKPLAYLEKCVGGPYTVWEKGNFAGKNDPPAWAANLTPPTPTRVRKEGSFCAGLLNLAERVNGNFIFKSTAISWAGGVKWWQERLISKGVAKPFVLLKNYPPGTLFLRRYTGAALKDQGHVAIMGRHGKLIQSDAFDGVPRPGINEKRTLSETHKLLVRFDGGGWEYYVRPEDWLK